MHHIPPVPVPFRPLVAGANTPAANERYNRLKPTSAQYTLRIIGSVGAVIGTAALGVGIIIFAAKVIPLLNPGKTPLELSSKIIVTAWIGGIIALSSIGVACTLRLVPDWKEYHSSEVVERYSKELAAMDIIQFKKQHLNSLFKFGMIPTELAGQEQGSLKTTIEDILRRHSAQETFKRKLEREYRGIEVKRREYLVPEGSPLPNSWAFNAHSNEIVRQYKLADQTITTIAAEWVALRDQHIVPHLPLPEQQAQ